jgi:predicted transcriptional regulator
MTPNDLSMHVLAALATAQFQGENVTLETLVDTVQARRADIRRAVTALHEAGLVDALRMKLTLAGFAAGHALAAAPMRPLRAPRMAIAAA